MVPVFSSVHGPSPMELACPKSAQGPQASAYPLGPEDIYLCGSGNTTSLITIYELSGSQSRVGFFIRNVPIYAPSPHTCNDLMDGRLSI
jgi:hypothetical protein